MLQETATDQEPYEVINILHYF